MFSKVKIFGHPVHPMLVSFPIALYTATLVAFILKASIKGPFWIKFAIATNVAGVGMALLAAIPGFVDWWIGIPRRSRAKRTGLWHMGFNLAALALFAVTLGIYITDWNGPFRVNVAPGIILAAAGVACTLAAGFFGWTLVQDHHVGVKMTGDQAAPEGETGWRLRRAG